MTDPANSLRLLRCEACQLRYLPSDSPCPRCGGRSATEYFVPAVGSVVVGTELHYPAEGWSAPHRLAFVEVADKVRLLAIVEGHLPRTGDPVSIATEGLVYRARAAPAAERGEGESPRSGSRRPSFEPPR